MTRIKTPAFFFLLGIAVGIIVWAKLTEKKDAPPDAGDWENVKDKLKYLEK